MSPRKPRAAAITPPAPEREWRPFFALFAGAFALRAAFILASPDRDWPFSIFFYGDSRHYRDYAEALLAGRLYDDGIPYHPPLYPALLAGLYGLLGGAAALKLAMAALNALAVALAGRWLAALAGRALAAPAAALLAGSFGWLLFSANYCSEALYLPLLCATLLLLHESRAGLSARSAAGLGLLTGLGALTRAEHLSLWPVFFLALWPLRDRALPERAHLKRWALAFAVSLAVVAPWTLRNWLRIGAWNRAHPGGELPRFAPVTLYGPVNFALGNHAKADGGFDPQPLLDAGAGDGATLDLAAPAQRELFLHGYRAGFAWIAAHPREAARNEWRKLDRLLDGFRLGWGQRAFPAGDAGTRPAVDVFVPRGGAWLKWGLAVLTSAGGLLALRRAHAEFRLPALLLLHRLAVTAVFFGYARGLLVVLPAAAALWLLAAKTVLPAEKSRPWLRRLALAIAAALALDAFWAAMASPRNYEASGATDAGGHIIQDTPVEIWPR